MTKSNIDLINESIRYTNYTAFQLTGFVTNPDKATADFNDWLASLAERGITYRGAYDIRAFRGDTALLLWLHSEQAESIQDALREFSHQQLGAHFQSTWSGMGIHRPAEFNRTHVPGFLLGHEPKKWLCMYPFVRSYDWYLIPESERREMLIEHGVAGRKYESILSSTVASFALGDYEWLLALESDELNDLVDMMRDLRYTEARRHVREEVPFFTGKLINPTEIGALFS